MAGDQQCGYRIPNKATTPLQPPPRWHEAAGAVGQEHCLLDQFLLQRVRRSERFTQMPPPSSLQDHWQVSGTMQWW